MTYNGLTIQVGINGRFFPEQWRPATEEITFLLNNGFRAIQFLGSAEGFSVDKLGAPFPVVAQALQEAGVTAVMEVNVHRYCQTLQIANYSGPVILEIGGTPWSGGFGQDTDAAVLDSRNRLLAALNGYAGQP